MGSPPAAPCQAKTSAASSTQAPMVRKGWVAAERPSRYRSCDMRCVLRDACAPRAWVSVVHGAGGRLPGAERPLTATGAAVKGGRVAGQAGCGSAAGRGRSAGCPPGSAPRGSAGEAADGVELGARRPAGDHVVALVRRGDRLLGALDGPGAVAVLGADAAESPPALGGAAVVADAAEQSSGGVDALDALLVVAERRLGGAPRGQRVPADHRGEALVAGGHRRLAEVGRRRRVA